MQLNSDVYNLGESMLNIDPKHRLKSSNKPSPVPITGKKVFSESQIHQNSEKPPPCRIYAKKKHQKASASNQKTPEKKPMPKAFKNKKIPKEFKKESKKKPLKHPTITICIKQSRENSCVAKVDQKIKTTKSNEKIHKTHKKTFSNIDFIIKNSLKQEKKKKIKLEKEKKNIEETKEIKKHEINNKNLLIREENLKFKKIKFMPRFTWGVNQSRFKDLQRLKKCSGKNSKRRPKSSERVKAGLDTIREIKYLKFRSKSLSERSDNRQSRNKSPWIPNPKLLAYIKQKQSLNKKKNNYEKLKKFAEESRKKAQLDHLHLLSKSLTHKHKKQTTKSVAVKKTHDEIEQEMLQEAKKIDLVYDSKIYPKENTSKLKLSITNEPEMNKFMESYSAKEKLSNDSFNSSLENSVYDLIDSREADVENKAATVIQYHIRKFLAKRRLERDQEYSSEDNQVKEIVNESVKYRSESPLSESDSCKILKKLQKKPKPFDLSIPSSNNSYYEKENLDSPVASNYIKDSEYQEIIKQQIILREAQIQNLEYLKQKEIRDVQAITNKIIKREDIGEALNVIVEKRYNHLLNLFQKNFAEAKETLINEMNTEEREEFEENVEDQKEELNKLIEKDSKIVEDYIEEVISRHCTKHSSPTESLLEEKKHSEIKNIGSSSIKDYTIIQESTINQVSSEEEQLGSLNMIMGDMVSPSSSYKSLRKSTKYYILSPSPDLMSPKAIQCIPFGYDTKQNEYFDSISINKDFSEFNNESKVQPTFSYSPDSIPERPSAPTKYFEKESMSSSNFFNIEKDKNYSDGSQIEWVANIDVTPETIVQISEQILLKLLKEVNSLKVSKEEIPFLNISNLSGISGISAISPLLPTEKFPHIETDPIAIRNYVEEIFTNSALDSIKKHLKTPLQKLPIEVLEKIHELDVGSICELDSYVYPDILDLKVYLDLKSNKENFLTDNLSPRTQQRLIEAEHVHNKMVFDAVNEALQRYRVHGTKGIPMPWSCSNRALGLAKPLDLIIQEVKETVFNWSLVQAGKICTENMLLSDGKLDEDLLNETREERLANMLFDEILEKEAFWIDYEFEETQVKLDLADIIIDSLAGELIKSLS